MADLFIVRCDRDKQRLWDHLKSLPLPWRVTAKTLTKKSRSSDYNRYYWGVLLYRVSSELGEDKMVVHELFKNLFLPLNPEIPEAEPTTSDITNKAFTDYCEWCRGYAFTEWGIVIESADEFFCE